MTPCPLCLEPVIVGEHDLCAMRIGGLRAHRQCALRSVLGGIGHLTAHEHWCLVMHDPDAGLSYRDSALAVGAYVDKHGIEETISQSVHHSQ